MKLKKENSNQIIKVAISIIVLILIILFILNWSDFAEGFSEGYNSYGN